MSGKKAIDFSYNLKFYWQIAKRKKKGLFVLIILALILEITYLADTYLLKILFDNGERFVSGTLEASGFLQVFSSIIIAFVIFGILRVIGRYLNIRILNRVDADLILDVKQYFFNHILGLSHKFHTTNKSGTIISRLVKSSSSIERFTDIYIFDGFPLLFRLGLVLFLTAQYSVSSALIIIGVAILFILFSYLLQRKQEPHSVAVNNAEDLDKASVSDFFTNIFSIKFFGKEAYIKKKFEVLITDTKKKMIINWDYWSWISAGQGFILAAGTVALLLVCTPKFLSQEMTMGSYVFIITAYFTLANLLYRFTHSLRDFFRTMADFEVLFQYNKIHNEITDSEDAKKYPITKGEVEFSDIVFSYGGKNVFDGLSLTVPKNKKVALVGHSGCGKTTLTALLYRLYDIQSGNIRIDGRDIKDYQKEWLRSEMSIVPQECILFDDTIYNNIKFSKPSASKKEVLNAIKAAQLNKIIKEFPKGLETIVGERGVKLSGGEKQRVSIARALLANKKILVLDEATSALDSETEHEIQQSLEKLMKGRTSVIIAHRLSTIMKADIIVVMKKGKIVEIDTHAELLKKKGAYHRLWQLQKGGFID